MGCEVRPESDYVGQSIRKCSAEAGEQDVDIVVILRQQDVLLPNPESVFKADDRLLVIVSRQGREWLEQHFAPLHPEASPKPQGEEGRRPAQE